MLPHERDGCGLGGSRTRNTGREISSHFKNVLMVRMHERRKGAALEDSELPATDSHQVEIVLSEVRRRESCVGWKVAPEDF